LAVGALLAGFLALNGCADDPIRASPDLSFEEYCVPSPELDPPPCEIDPPPTVDPRPGDPGLWIGWSPESCFGGWDVDSDGLHNGCENAVAAAFAPDLVVSHECGWDNSLGRKGGEYYYAVQRLWGGDMRIAYLPGYYLDCGVTADLLPICLGNFVLKYCNGHTGDSEFILIDVTYDYDSQHWIPTRIFLSAHCNQISGDECRWYYDLSVFEWRDGHQGGAPVVWVSRRKHANYPSEEECDSGVSVGIPPFAIEFEHCEANAIQRFPVVFGQQNVGSRLVPLPAPCGTAFSGSPMTSPSVRECIWTGRRFNGWQGYISNGGAEVYGSLLEQFAGF
jgi:hypothetical protein